MRNRYLFWFCSSYIFTAIIAAVCKSFLAATLAICAFAVLSVLVLSRKGARISAALVVIGIAFSIIWQSIYFSNDKIEPRFLEREVYLSGTVVSFVEETSTGGASFRVKISGEPDVRLIVYSTELNEMLTPGDIVNFRATVYEYENRDGFAEKTYYKSRYIDARAYTDDVELSGRVSNAKLRFLPQYLSQYTKERIDVLFDGSSSALVKSLILGDTGDLSDDFTEDLRRTGLSHIVSVSGMHISFLVAFVLLFTKNRYLKLLAIPPMFIFAFVVGASQSALRAVIMQSLVLASSVAKREYDSLTSLSFAAFVLAFVNPYCVTDVGFLLSFSATLGIVLLYKPLFDGFLHIGKKLSGILKKLFLSFIAVLSVTIAAMLFTTPISAYLFNSFSVIAPLSNTLLNFAVMLIFMGAFTVILLSFICLPIAKGAAVVLDMLVDFVTKIIKTLSNISFAEMFTGDTLVILTVAFLCFVAVYAILAGRKKIRRWFAVVIALVVLITVPTLRLAFSEEEREGVRFDVLDVGQGQCVVATCGDECVIIDCGGEGDAENVAISHLLSRGIADIDALILTHGHADHANGAQYLIETIDTKTVYMPASDKNNATFIRVSGVQGENGTVFVEKDMTFALSDMEVSILTLPEGKDENENGLVVIVRDGDYELLVTGDLPDKLERHILDRVPDCESYIVGHHGSKTSSSQALLNKALPELCLISVGEGNSYGHPNEATLSRIEKLGSEVHRTDIEGTLTFYSR
ncbi:MAG: DNA internalization-related competence protein ComEC/Rec2 [Oscillospiraceae bacterium]|nr:DNA internalization-related competence protein ComEC/Rec2 [Oscillospiraceae bacterium]